MNKTANENKSLIETIKEAELGSEELQEAIRSLTKQTSSLNQDTSRKLIIALQGMEKVQERFFKLEKEVNKLISKIKSLQSIQATYEIIGNRIIRTSPPRHRDILPSHVELLSAQDLLIQLQDLAREQGSIEVRYRLPDSDEIIAMRVESSLYKLN